MVVLSATTKYSSDEIKHAAEVYDWKEIHLQIHLMIILHFLSNSIKKMHQKNRPDIPVFNNNVKKPFMIKGKLLSF